MNKKWERYEDVARYLLDKIRDEFNLVRVEGKQKISGTTTPWEIDARGVLDGSAGFIVVECRRYIKSKQSQEKIAALAFKIDDTGAAGGIIVSPLGLQAGAKKVAQSKRIISVIMSSDSTPQEFCIQFLNKIFIGIVECISATDSYSPFLSRKCRCCCVQFEVIHNEDICPQCVAK